MSWGTYTEGTYVEQMITNLSEENFGSNETKASSETYRFIQVKFIVSVIPSETGHQKRILSQAIKDKTLNANIDCSLLPNTLVVLIETKEETQTPITLKECLLQILQLSWVVDILQPVVYFKQHTELKRVSIGDVDEGKRQNRFHFSHSNSEPSESSTISFSQDLQDREVFDVKKRRFIPLIDTAISKAKISSSVSNNSGGSMISVDKDLADLLKITTLSPPTATQSTNEDSTYIGESVSNIEANTDDRKITGTRRIRIPVKDDNRFHKQVTVDSFIELENAVKRMWGDYKRIFYKADSCFLLVIEGEEDFKDLPKDTFAICVE